MPRSPCARAPLACGFQTVCIGRHTALQDRRLTQVACHHRGTGAADVHGSDAVAMAERAAAGSRYVTRQSRTGAHNKPDSGG